MKNGARIMTKGGMHGVITGMTDTVVTLEIAKDVNIKVSRDAIAGAIGKDGTQAIESAKKAGG